MAPYSIAIIGVGKVARDKHLPVIAASPAFRLAGAVSRADADVAGAPCFATPAELYAALPTLDAVAICTPPNVRHRLACEALDAGKHVLLEKPAAPTLAEMRDLAARAAARGRVIFAASHSQFHPPVEAARCRLVGRRLRRVAIEWTEDVRVWHPGQQWVWEAGNFGVFDTGLNALSILARIAPAPLSIASAEMLYPANCATPIAASLALACPAAGPEATLTAIFDWRREGGEDWRVEVETVDGQRLALVQGGAKLFVDGVLAAADRASEYVDVYARFAELIDRGESEVDETAAELVETAFAIAERRTVEPFAWAP